MPPITVIPTCADLHRFTIQGPPQREPFVLGYIGSVGTWYLLDEMLECFRQAQAEEPRARLLVVNRGEQDLIRSKAGSLGIGPEALEIVAADHQGMPRQIAPDERRNGPNQAGIFQDRQRPHQAC